MFQQIAISKIVPSSRNLFRSRRINKFSNGPIKDENNQTETDTKQSSETDTESSFETEKVSRLLNESAVYKDVNDQIWATTPYPKDVQVIKNDRPRVDPKDTCILLFPGQGTIKVGMVKKYIHFPAAKELFETANEILNYNLLKLCLDGPQEKLNRTEFNQSATVVSSLAALEKIREEKPKVFTNCIATAGYSVGEITALIVSGAITFEDGVRLVCIRGKSMQFASDKTSQGMLSVLCTPAAKVHEACKEAEQWAMNMGVENPVCRVAIYLATQRKILAGNTEALEYIEKHKEKFGFTNLNRLPVSGAFHTPLMEPALPSVKRMLSSIEIDQPRCNVYSNYKAAQYSNLKYMKKFILKQIVSPVRWEQCMQKMYSRPPGMSFPDTYDIASGGRMKTLLKLINLKASESCTAI